MSKTIRLAGAQLPVGTDIQLNKREILQAMDWAKENEVDHLLTPEGSLSGWYGGWECKLDELKEALKEVEDHQKKLGIGLHLGTNFKETEPCGDFLRNEIRHYNKGGDLRGLTIKALPIFGTECVLPKDQKRDPIVVVDLLEESIDQLVDDKIYEQSIAAGLICNDLYGSGEIGVLPITTMFKQMNVLDVVLHATNGRKMPEDDPCFEVFDLWHEAHLRMSAWNMGIPILTADACTMWDWDGNEDEIDTYRTSSTSGFVTPHEGWVVTVPRYGRQYFKYDYTLPGKQYFNSETGEEVFPND